MKKNDRMRNNDAFSAFHPIVNFLYFGLVLGFSMFYSHPVCILVSLSGAAFYYVYLKGVESVLPMLRFALPLFLLTALINPAFNHQGTILLCYLPTGNPLTLESILYGIFAGCTLAAVLLWFACYSEIMTSDKFVYLFGKIIPAMSLVLSMALRFVPKFKLQLDAVREAQAGIGADTVHGSLIKRTKNAITCFSIMITWSLENAIDTADSMKSRGYGIRGRTAFSIYTFTERDRTALLWLCFCGMYLLSGGLSGNLKWSWFPSVRGMLTEPLTVSFYLVYAALCLTPWLIGRRKEQP